MLRKEVQMGICLGLGIMFSIAGAFNPFLFIPSAMFISAYIWLIFFNAHASNKELVDMHNLKAMVADLQGQVSSLNMVIGGRR